LVWWGYRSIGHLGSRGRSLQAGFFSAVDSALITDVQSELEPEPNEMTAAHTQIFIHAVSGSLFPDWTGTPSGVVTVQALLYISFAISLFAAFLVILGRRWIPQIPRWSRCRRMPG